MPMWSPVLIVFLTISSLIAMAFITLMERKILGLAQFRKGPWKVSALGMLQPIADAIKLFSKTSPTPVNSNLWVFLLSPLMAMILALSIWIFFPLTSVLMSIEFSAIGMIMVLSLGIYPLFMSGWSSNSKYSMVGSLRGVAQTISYEISLSVILISILIFISTPSLAALTSMSFYFPALMLSPLGGVLWIVSAIAETNRTPFDFSEGESELVSGFNTEFGAALFAMIFMSEYIMILFFSFLSSFIFIGTFISTPAIIGGMLVFFWVWVRASYPRYRYDKLMNLAWKALLPIALTLTLWSTSMFIL